MNELSAVILKFISLVLAVEEAESFPPPLSREEERLAFERMRAGDKKARDTLIERNLRLVSHIVKKYYLSEGAVDELISVGSLGLIKAVDSFKSEFGTRFATHAARCVQNEILMYFRSRKKLSGEVSINDTIDVDKDGNPLTYLDVIAEESDVAGELDLRVHTERVIELVDTVLDKREREIILLRYGLYGYAPLTQREVARHLGISRSYVSRIEKRALLKMRDGFGGAVVDFDD